MIAIVLNNETNNYNIVIESSKGLNHYITLRQEIFNNNFRQLFHDLLHTKDTITHYLAHMASTPFVKQIIAIDKIVSFSHDNYSLITLAEKSDEMSISVGLTMLKSIQKGKIVCVNSVGGYSLIDDTELKKNYTIISECHEDYIENQVCSAETLKHVSNFLETGTIQKSAFTITEKTLVIENTAISLDMIEYLKSTQYQVLANFFIYAKIHSTEELVNTFQKGFDNGLNKIIIETTGTYHYQFELITKLLKHIKFDHELEIVSNYDLTEYIESYPNVKFTKVTF